MTRRIDHLVLAVHDLDAAAAAYERQGFTVGARNRHPWGTENRIIQFESSFLELISVGDGARIPSHAPGQFSFGAFVRDYLTRREGLAMLVLDSADAKADAAHHAATGIGDFAPFFFERKGKRPDGTPTHVAFTLAFAVDPGLDAAFFVCQQHFPEAFWNAGLQRHDNGATNVTEVCIEASDPARHADFLRAYSGVPGENRFALDRAGAIVVNPGAANALTGFTIAAGPECAGRQVELFGCRIRFTGN